MTKETYALLIQQTYSAIESAVLRVTLCQGHFPRTNAKMHSKRHLGKNIKHVNLSLLDDNTMTAT